MREKILIVEDDEVLGKTIKEYLELKDFDVGIATNGIVAIEMYKSFHPRIVLLDILLPGKNGYEVAMEMRKTDQITPILFMTGTEKTIEDKSHAYNIGAVDFIEKPFLIEELYYKIKTWLNTRLLPKDSKNQYRINGELLTLHGQTLIYKDITIDFIERELIVLSVLLDNINQVVLRETLLLTVWKVQTEKNSKMLNNYISNLKKGLEPLNQILEIRTIYGKGVELKINEGRNNTPHITGFCGF